MAERKTTNKSNSKAAQTSKTANSKRTEEILKKERQRRNLYSVIIFAIGALVTMFSLIGKSDAVEPNGADYIHSFLCGVFGVGVFFTGPLVIYVSIMLAFNRHPTKVRNKIIQLILFLLVLNAGIQIIFIGDADGFKAVYEAGKNLQGGGIIGLLLAAPLLFFGRPAATVIVILIVFIMIMLVFDITIPQLVNAAAKPFKKLQSTLKESKERSREENEIIRAENKRLEEENKLKRSKEEALKKDREILEEIERAKKFESIQSATNSVRGLTEGVSNTEMVAEKADDEEILPEDVSEKLVRKPLTEFILDNINDALPVEGSDGDGPYFPDLAENNAVIDAINAFKEENEKEEEIKSENEEIISKDENLEVLTEEIPKETVIEKLIEEEIDDMEILSQQYKLPPSILLNDIIHERSQEEIDLEIEQNSVKLVDTLKSFGVETKMVGVCRGPSVTRYELQPAPGVAIARITKLVDDIALNLATAGVRIEAPIPNKAAVGIEVPNRQVETVPLRSLIESEVFAENHSKLGAALGKAITGETILADIAKMPHILIAGTTGSGKSVCVNSIIMSILFRSTPEEVRLLMIDPKAVEFMIYNGIPHLLIPVVTDPKKASGALGWAVTEMLSRYKMFSDNNVRDIAGFNSLAEKNPELKKLPQIVIFIDELADLMMASPKEVEDSICRLAQMARAAGMHLVIATQRPSVNVVTGVIKANIPSRIALKVASQVDSRTIIDSAGAEKLLGKGDMLYFPVGAPKPMRVQGCWVSDKEVDRVVSFIKNSFTLDYDESVIEEIDRQAELAAQNDKKSKSNESGDIDTSDEKLEEAIEAVIEAGQASTSYLQRKLKLGYGRAARLIDIMQEMGIVGTFEGSKPRQVIMTREEWYERKMNQSD